MHTRDEVLSFWRTGGQWREVARPRLLFGRMFEDEALELAEVPRHARVFAIASAGCTALALARRGHEVLAVDVNPEQVAYVRRRLAGGPLEAGQVDLNLRRLREFSRWAGLSPSAWDEFLNARRCDEQLDLWRTKFLRGPRHWFLRAALSKVCLRLFYPACFVACLPERCAEVFLGRIERTLARIPNRSNPWMQRLWGAPEMPAASTPMTGRVSLACADAAEFLEAQPRGSFQAFTLSNVLDGAGPDYAARLWAAIRNAAAPGAVAILRSLGQPQDELARIRAARERSALWGGVYVRALS